LYYDREGSGEIVEIQLTNDTDDTTNKTTVPMVTEAVATSKNSTLSWSIVLVLSVMLLGYLQKIRNRETSLSTMQWIEIGKA